MTDKDKTPDPDSGRVEGFSDEIELSNWVFKNRTPTSDEVVKLLETLEPVWGVETKHYADFIQPLKQGSEWRLYMSVAGRLKMLEAAQRINKWMIDLTPDPPVEVAGIVMQRTMLEISGPNGRLGVRYGTASLSKFGRPWEKLETACNGRAIAAWGFGILPASGVASLEEMQIAREGPAESPEKAPTKSRGELLQDVLTLAEEAAQLRGEDEFETRKRLVVYVKDRFGTEITKAQDENERITEVDWSKVRPGQLQLLTNTIKDTIRKLKADTTAV